MKKRDKNIIIISLVLLFGLMVLNLNTGTMKITPKEIIDTFLGKGSERQKIILFDLRLPRLLLAIVIGWAMSVSGCIMQSLLRNDMASPGTLGISSGSGLLGILSMTLVASTSAATLPIMAFLGGILSALLVFFLSYRKNKEMNQTVLILTGVALGTGYNAIILLLSLKLPSIEYQFVERWLAGSLWGSEWKYIRIIIPWTILFSGYIYYKSRILNAISLGNNTAIGLGVEVKKEFLGLSLASVALASGSAALGGNFFFVGMISPHIAKKLVGSDHKILIIMSAIVGSIVVLLGDILTRIIDFNEGISTGIIITIISAPYFLYLLIKSE